MKLKSFHYILIVFLALELIVCSILVINRPRELSTAELSIEYEQSNGVYTLQSELDDDIVPSFKFSRAEQTYTFDGNFMQLIECYTSYEKFIEHYPNTTQMVWTTFKTSAYNTAFDAMFPDTNTDRLIALANSWYSVDSYLLPTNTIYSIHFTDSRNDWDRIFEPWVKYTDDGNLLPEMVLPATIRVNKKAYAAIAYMVVNADTVTTYIRFGDSYLNDFNASTAEISIHTPDGSATIAHTNMNMAFMAGSVESRYREIINAGGLS